MWKTVAAAHTVGVRDVKIAIEEEDEDVVEAAAEVARTEDPEDPIRTKIGEKLEALRGTLVVTAVTAVVEKGRTGSVAGATNKSGRFRLSTPL